MSEGHDDAGGGEASDPPADTAPSEASARAALFSLPPGQFVAQRNALATQLRKAGQREAATRIKALKKPTPPAWAANALHRQAPELMEAALAAGAALRWARETGGLSASEMQARVAAQREAMAALLRRAPGLATTAGVNLTRAHLAALQGTLEALCAGVAADGLGQLEEALQPPSFDALSPAAAPPRRQPGAGAAAAQPEQPSRASAAPTPAPSATSSAQSPPGTATGPNAPQVATAATPRRQGPSPAPLVTQAERARAHVMQRLRQLEAVRDARSAERRRAQRRALDAAEQLQRARDEVASAEQRLRLARDRARQAEAQLQHEEQEAVRLTTAVRDAQQAVQKAHALLDGAGDS